jgi:hypothetical protein
MDEKMNAILTPNKRLNGKQIRANERENAAQTYQKQGDAGMDNKMPQIVSNFGACSSRSFCFILECFCYYLRSNSIIKVFIRQSIGDKPRLIC